MNFAPRRSDRALQRDAVQGRDRTRGEVLLNQPPESFQKTVGAFHTVLGPLQGLLRRRREQAEQAHRIRSVALDQRLRIDRVALGFGHLGAVLQHHALGEQAREGFVRFHQPFVAHKLVEETRVEQVQDSVFDAAHVLIHGQPVIGRVGIEHPRAEPRAGKAGVVPGGLHKGVEGVCLALPGHAVQIEAAPLGIGLDRRRHAVHHHILGQHRGQARGRNRYLSAVRPGQHGDGRTPVALPRYAPVAQAKLRGDAAHGLSFKGGGNRVEGGCKVQSVKGAGAGEHAVPGVGGCRDIRRPALGRADHRAYRQRVAGGELPVAFVVGRDGHHRPGAVIHKHVVRYPDRYLGARQRVQRAQAGVHTALFRPRPLGFGNRRLSAFVDKRAQRGIVPGQFAADRVLGRET